MKPQESGHQLREQAKSMRLWRNLGLDVHIVKPDVAAEIFERAADKLDERKLPSRWAAFYLGFFAALVCVWLSSVITA